MPNFSKKRRQPIRLHQLNPFLRMERRKAADQFRDAAFNAIWDSVEDGPQ